MKVGWTTRGWLVILEATLTFVNYRVFVSSSQCLLRRIISEPRMSD